MGVPSRQARGCPPDGTHISSQRGVACCVSVWKLAMPLGLMLLTSLRFRPIRPQHVNRLRSDAPTSAQEVLLASTRRAQQVAEDGRPQNAAVAHLLHVALSRLLGHLLLGCIYCLRSGRDRSPHAAPSRPRALYFFTVASSMACPGFSLAAAGDASIAKDDNVAGMTSETLRREVTAG